MAVRWGGKVVHHTTEETVHEWERGIGLRIAGFAVLAAAVVAGPGCRVEAGRPGPAFTLPGSDGKSYSLAEFKGKQPVVLALVSEAFTAG